jgi:hypothetical protein
MSAAVPGKIYIASYLLIYSIIGGTAYLLHEAWVAQPL